MLYGLALILNVVNGAHRLRMSFADYMIQFDVCQLNPIRPIHPLCCYWNDRRDVRFYDEITNERDEGIFASEP